MRAAFIFGRTCLRHGAQRTRFFFPRNQQCFSSAARHSTRQGFFRRPPIAGTILLGALSPAAFVQLSEQDVGNGKTGEELMLEASRAEIEKHLPDNVHGLRRAWKGFVLFLDNYIYEPIATGFRFLHLVLIFVPVIFTVPAIWVGIRRKDRDNERSGTLWWYGFLVHSMERAGPAFIKVYYHIHLCFTTALLILVPPVGSMGSVTNRHLPK